MRLAALQSIICIELADILGYLLPPWPSCFQPTYVVSTRYRPPYPLESGFILSCAWHSLQSTRPFQTRLTPFRAPATFPEVFFLFATLVQRIHSSMNIPSPSMFRPQCFSHSRRLAPLCTLRAYFISLPRPGFTFQGVSPLPSRFASSTIRPLLALATFSSSRVAPTVQIQQPVLQGFDPGNNP
jgi:hypothetical protein